MKHLVNTENLMLSFRVKLPLKKVFSVTHQWQIRSTPIFMNYRIHAIFKSKNTLLFFYFNENSNVFFM